MARSVSVSMAHNSSFSTLGLANFSILSFSSRSSIAPLSSASRPFRSEFLPSLYADLLDPPLTLSQSSRLIQTLSETERLPVGPHPVLFIHKLSVKKAPIQQTALFIDSLKAGSRHDQGAGLPLSVLHWDSPAGFDKLGATLGAPGKFPYLKERIEAFKDLMATVNGIHLSFELSIDIKSTGDEENDDVPSPNFTPFLTAHP
ncbi:hypothetical protein C8J57DRAFT_1522413 [Mycena rebaudengoi]|nr:hypothetical protein C8J57DRAFT_1522413 [Mycena rebaudengoi]